MNEKELVAKPSVGRKISAVFVFIVVLFLGSFLMKLIYVLGVILINPMTDRVLRNIEAGANIAGLIIIVFIARFFYTKIIGRYKS